MVNICTRKIFHRFQVNRIRSKAGAVSEFLSPSFRIFIARRKGIESNRTIGNHGNGKEYIYFVVEFGRGKETCSKLKGRRETDL